MKRLALVVLLAAIPTASLTVEGAAAPTRVRLVRVTSPVAAGDYATLVARVFPRRVCSIAVYYTTRASEAAGLARKRPRPARQLNLEGRDEHDCRPSSDRRDLRHRGEAADVVRDA
jgi:hypothetical protein